MGVEDPKVADALERFREDYDFLLREIEAQIGESTMLRDTWIEIHVEQRMVVLTGEVRLY